MRIPSEYANSATSNNPHIYSVLNRSNTSPSSHYEEVHNKYLKYKTKYLELKRLIKSSNV
jgi:hypothetical protein